jgi:acyl-CoA synthetase (AMP-forming)/AMP-acid ligase II
MITFGDIPRKGAKVCPDKTAVIFEDTRLTYRTFNERINRLANALIKLGYKEGERVAILAENTHKYMEVYFAASKAGMSVTPLNIRLANNEFAYIINDSESAAMFLGDGYEKRILDMRGQLKNIRHYITLDNHLEGCLLYEKILEESSPEDPYRDGDEDDMAILMYTGGTTGLPKGVMMSHRNLMTGAYSQIVGHSMTRHDIECYQLGQFHVSVWGIYCTFMVMGTVVILRRVDLKNIVETIQNEKCTHIVMVPTILVWLLDLPDLDKYDLSSLRLITYGGSPISPEVLKRCINKFGKIFDQGYGLTEACPFGTVMFPEDHYFEGTKIKLLSSIGKEGMTVELLVLDENDKPVKPGETGEICLRGKNNMMGYWKNPELTAETLRNGWLHTGDFGTVDEEGYIYLKDRKSDMIITGGENVYPKEVEDILVEHPAVQECAVASAPDEKWGERVQAVVLLKKGHEATESELITHCKERLAGYKCPKKIEFWDSVPKSALGKIQRNMVKKEFWKGRDRQIG